MVRLTRLGNRAFWEWLQYPSFTGDTVARAIHQNDNGREKVSNINNKHIPEDLDSLTRKDMVELFKIQIEEHQGFIKEIESLREQLAKANERADEMLARLGESEARLASSAITGSGVYPSEALNKFAIEKKIEALESCIADNAMDNNEIDALIVYVDDVRADIEQLRKEQSKC